MYDQKFTIATNTNLGLVRLFVQYMRKIPKTSIHCRDHESINVIILTNYSTIILSIHDGSFLLSHHSVFDFVHSLLGLSIHEHYKANWNLIHAYFQHVDICFQGFSTTGTKAGEGMVGDITTSFTHQNVSTNVKIDTKSNVGNLITIFKFWGIYFFNM